MLESILEPIDPNFEEISPQYNSSNSSTLSQTIRPRFGEDIWHSRNEDNNEDEDLFQYKEMDAKSEKPSTGNTTHNIRDTLFEVHFKFVMNDEIYFGLQHEFVLFCLHVHGCCCLCSGSDSCGERSGSDCF